MRYCLFAFLLFLSINDLIGQTTYTVNAIDDTDDGVCNAIHCSLREAINQANTDLGPSRIEFNIGAGGVETIFLSDALPPLTEAEIVIDGMTQNGQPGGVRIDCAGIGVQTQDILSILSDDTEVYGLELFNYTISENAMMEGAGSMIGVGGIFIPASPTNVVIGGPGRGNIIHTINKTRITNANYGNGIGVHSGGDVVIQGNRIGMEYLGLLKLPVWGEGIRVDEIQFGTTFIGGENPGEENIIGNCNRGIGLFGGEGWVKGNYLGCLPDLTTKHSNRSNGIIVNLGDYYEIGGINSDEGNFCLYNESHGISINTLIQNYIGYNTCGFNEPTSSGIFVIACPDCEIVGNTCYGQQTGIFIDDSGNTRVNVENNELFDNTDDGIQMNWLPTATDIVASENSTYCNGRGIGVGVKGPVSPFNLLTIDVFDLNGLSGRSNPGALIEIFIHDTTGCEGAFCQGKFFVGNTFADGVGQWTYTGNIVSNTTYTCTQTILPERLTSPFSNCVTIEECTTVVTTTADNGNGSLRAAIICANTTPGPDTITFDIPGAAPIFIIEPFTPLPMITDEATVIDASTQPTGEILLDGSSLGPFDIGLSFQADSSELYGIGAYNFGFAAVEFGTNVKHLNALKIGDPTRPNQLYQSGICLQVYGGKDVAIKSNILGNRSDFSMATTPSNFGCELIVDRDSENVVFGGSKTLNEGNTIVNSAICGLQLQSAQDAPQVRVFGNYIGTDIGETIVQPNCSALSNLHGAITLTILGGSIIGDGTDDHINVIAHNFRPGIYALFEEHQIKNNSFYCNQFFGIDLNSQGQNANFNKPAPFINVSTDQQISGLTTPLDTVEVYLNDNSSCPDAPCQGRYILGKTVANNAGVWSISAPFNRALFVGDLVTGLAYDIDGNTSDFSICQEVCPEVMITVSNGGPYCQGDSIFLFSNVGSPSLNIQYLWNGPQGYTSADANPTDASLAGIYTLEVNIEGCMYPIVETNVIIHRRDTTSIDSTLCSEDVLMVGAEVFDISRPNGSVLLKNVFNCDSLVNVDLKFEEGFAEAIRDTLCEDDFIIYRGQRYDRNNPSNSDTITSALGCDSIFSVDLTFNMNSGRLFDRTLCFGDTLIVNGKVYDENNPMGTDTVPNSLGCDSVIVVDLTFSSGRVSSIDSILCADDFIIANGKRYDRSNPTGSDTLVMGSIDGCDSIIDINLSFFEEARLVVDTILCRGDFLEFNNIRYDLFYPAGIDIIEGGSQGGCDSIIDVTLTFYEAEIDIDTIDPTCAGKTDGAIIFNQIDGIPGPFELFFNGNGPLIIDTLPFTLNNLDEGDYLMVITDSDGCDHPIQARLVENGNLNITVTPELTINKGDQVDLTFNSNFTADSIFWISNGDTLCIDCESFTVNPEITTTYEVWVYRAGCFVMESIVVNIIVNTNFYFPTSFSPDGNNINDIFTGYGNGDDIIIETLEIYSRWGELVYKGENIITGSNEGWNGTFNGEKLSPGVFVYRAVIAFTDQQRETLVGEVTLVY